MEIKENSRLDMSIKAVERFPDEPGWYIRLGGDWRQVKEYDNALIAYKKAMELDPIYVLAYNSCAHTYAEMGEYNNAVIYFTKAIEVSLNNKKSEAYISRAFFYENIGEESKALDDYNRAINVAPKERSAYF